MEHCGASRRWSLKINQFSCTPVFSGAVSHAILVILCNSCNPMQCNAHSWRSQNLLFDHLCWEVTISALQEPLLEHWFPLLISAFSHVKHVCGCYFFVQATWSFYTAKLLNPILKWCHVESSLQKKAMWGLYQSATHNPPNVLGFISTSFLTLKCKISIMLLEPGKG